METWAGAQTACDEQVHPALFWRYVALALGSAGGPLGASGGLLGASGCSWGLLSASWFRPGAPDDLLRRPLAWQKRCRKRRPFAAPVSANLLPRLAASWGSGGFQGNHRAVLIASPGTSLRAVFRRSTSGILFGLCSREHNGILHATCLSRCTLRLDLFWSSLTHFLKFEWRH